MAHERLMLWMIVNCSPISGGCERDNSTIKFDRLPLLLLLHLSRLQHPVTSLNHSNFLSFCFFLSSFSRSTFTLPFTLSSFFHLPICYLNKGRFKGDVTDIPAVSMMALSHIKAAFQGSWNLSSYLRPLDYTGLTPVLRQVKGLAHAHMAIIRDSWKKRHRHQAMTPSLFELERRLIVPQHLPVCLHWTEFGVMLHRVCFLTCQYASVVSNPNSLVVRDRGRFSAGQHLWTSHYSYTVLHNNWMILHLSIHYLQFIIQSLKVAGGQI